MTPTRARRATPDTGSVTLFLVITVVGLLVLLGLVVDGGARLRGIQHADALAAEAARAAGQVIDQPAAITGASPGLDVHAAADAARDFLTRQGATGTVTVDVQARALQVNVTSHTDTVFLALVGITRLTIHGHARVVLVRVVSGAPT